MKEKIKTQKGFIQIIIAIVIILAGIGTSYGIIYSHISNVIKEAQLLTKEEKYNEAIEKLEIVQNMWFIKNLGIKKQAVATELEKNKKLLEDKTEYTQGSEEFNKGNWEQAKELLSKVSENSPYYQDATSKIKEAQNKITEKQVAEAIKKATEETQSKIAEEEAKRKAAEAQLERERQITLEKITKLQLEKQKAEEQKAIELQLAKVPSGYYQSDKFRNHNNTLEELESFLVNEFMLPRGYKVDEFDCSESSAYLEWALEDAGFTAYIATGPAPWNPQLGYHAWVIVITNDNKSVAIESTVLTNKDFPQEGLVNVLKYLFTSKAPGIVYYNENDPVSQNYYYHYDHLYKDIYEAIRGYGSAEEWNWWEGYWGFM